MGGVDKHTVVSGEETAETVRRTSSPADAVDESSTSSSAPSAAAAGVVSGSSSADGGRSGGDDADKSGFWRCDVCLTAMFPSFEQALRHERSCDRVKNGGSAVDDFERAGREGKVMGRRDAERRKSLGISQVETGKSEDRDRNDAGAALVAMAAPAEGEAVPTSPSEEGLRPRNKKLKMSHPAAAVGGVIPFAATAKVLKSVPVAVASTLVAAAATPGTAADTIKRGLPELDPSADGETPTDSGRKNAKASTSVRKEEVVEKEPTVPILPKNSAAEFESGIGDANAEGKILDRLRCTSFDSSDDDAVMMTNDGGHKDSAAEEANGTPAPEITSAKRVAIRRECGLPSSSEEKTPETVEGPRDMDMGGQDDFGTTGATFRSAGGPSNGDAVSALSYSVDPPRAKSLGKIVARSRPIATPSAADATSVQPNGGAVVDAATTSKNSSKIVTLEETNDGVGNRSPENVSTEETTTENAVKDVVAAEHSASDTSAADAKMATTSTSTSVYAIEELLATAAAAADHDDDSDDVSDMKSRWFSADKLKKAALAIFVIVGVSFAVALVSTHEGKHHHQALGFVSEITSAVQNAIIPAFHVDDLPTSDLTLRQYLDHPDGFHAAFAPAFFGYFAYFGALAAVEEGTGGRFVPRPPPRVGDNVGEKDEGCLLKSVSGASSGALAAVLLAAGIQPQRAAEFVSAFTWRMIADPPGVGGFVKGNQIEEIIADFLIKNAAARAETGAVGEELSSADYQGSGSGNGDRTMRLEDALIPVAVSGFDLLSMKGRLLERGSMAKAARASVGFPGLFQPVAWREDEEGEHSPPDPIVKDSSSWLPDALLIDGGITDGLGLLGLSILGFPGERKRIVNMVVGDFGVRGPPGPSNLPKGVNAESIVSISIVNTPQCGPWAMANGPKAVQSARRAMEAALDVPMRKGKSDGHYILQVDASRWL